VGGKRHGKGILILANGSKYEGNFLRGKQTGKGKYTWPSGDVYRVIM